MIMRQQNLSGVPVVQSCPACGGDGWEWEWEEERAVRRPCPACHGVPTVIADPAILGKRGMSKVSTTCGWWSAEARETIAGLPPGLAFTSDLLRERLQDPPHPNAVGAALNSAARSGVIQATGRFTPSLRPKGHGRKIQVWMKL